MQRNGAEGWDLVTSAAERERAKRSKIWREGLSCGRTLSLSRTYGADGWQALNRAQMLSVMLRMTEVAHTEAA